MVPALAAAIPAVDINGADHDLDREHHPNLLRLALAHALDVLWLVPGWIMLLEYGALAVCIAVIGVRKFLRPAAPDALWNNQMRHATLPANRRVPVKSCGVGNRTVVI